jgi:hypothetical protein
MRERTGSEQDPDLLRCPLVLSRRTVRQPELHLRRVPARDLQGARLHRPRSMLSGLHPLHRRHLPTQIQRNRLRKVQRGQVHRFHGWDGLLRLLGRHRSRRHVPVLRVPERLRQPQCHPLYPVPGGNIQQSSKGVRHRLSAMHCWVLRFSSILSLRFVPRRIHQPRFCSCLRPVSTRVQDNRLLHRPCLWIAEQGDAEQVPSLCERILQRLCQHHLSGVRCWQVQRGRSFTVHRLRCR